MNTATRMIEVELQGDTLVLTPQGDLRELDYQEIEAEGEELLRLAEDPAVKNVVVDFARTDYFGSTALGLFARLWKRVRARGGRMALCNVSAHESQIMAVTRLASFWPVLPSREEALAALAA
jgi:stage II sporulation protein AA (anti-sigma F factor antagonist)